MLRRSVAFAMLLASAMTSAAAPATQPAPIYTDIADAYMTCQWDTLDTLLKTRLKEITSLPKSQADDIAAVRLAITECRPAWWPTVKAGKKTLFRVSMWGRAFGATYDPECKSSMQLTVNGGVAALVVNWPVTDMDNPAPAEHGFSKADLADLGIFATLGGAESWALLPPAQAPLNEAGKLALGRYLDYRGNIGAIVYANPGGRRWGIWLFLAAFKEKFAAMPTRMGREAIGALFVGEVLTHPEIYTSIDLPQTLAAENAEATLAAALADGFEKHAAAWTLSEDLAFRTAAKQLATATGLKTYTTGQITLPNKLALALDPDADKPLKPKRDAWVKERFDKIMKDKAAKQNP